MDSQKLIYILEECGYNPHSYSGRFMWGKQCVAISGDIEPFDVGFNIGSLVANSTDMSPSEVLDQLEWRTDSMGMGTVVYFPNFEWQR
jgi:hypothetical protein